MKLNQILKDHVFDIMSLTMGDEHDLEWHEEANKITDGAADKIRQRVETAARDLLDFEQAEKFMKRIDKL